MPAGVAERSTESEILGQTMRTPLVIAPVGGQVRAHPDGELATVRAATNVSKAAAGIGIANYTSDLAFIERIPKHLRTDRSALAEEWLKIFRNPGLPWDRLQFLRDGALGASATLVGRAFLLYRLALEGEASVDHAPRATLAKFGLTLALTGRRSHREVRRDRVWQIS